MRFSQVGCTLACRFCHTDTKARRNLTAAEITGQLVAARDALEDWPTGSASNSGARKITNIVLMGMGEPLYNTDNVIAALNVMSDGDGLALSAAHHTVDIGVVPDIARSGLKPALCWQFPCTPCTMICATNWCR